jgi:two-component system, cell cycle sensor histidine kinase and response regulator CckA
MPLVSAGASRETLLARSAPSSFERAFACFIHQDNMKTVDDLSPTPSGQIGTAPSVLVVDDETAVRRFAARVLQRDGFAVFEAVDGLEALEMLKNGHALVNVVVSDIVMPRLNGVELMQALAVSHPDLPVILMSGYATGALNELGIAVPCGIVNKPFPPERLLAEVHRCIRKK